MPGIEPSQSGIRTDSANSSTLPPFLPRPSLPHPTMPPPSVFCTRNSLLEFPKGGACAAWDREEEVEEEEVVQDEEQDVRERAHLLCARRQIFKKVNKIE